VGVILVSSHQSVVINRISNGCASLAFQRSVTVLKFKIDLNDRTCYHDNDDKAKNSTEGSYAFRDRKPLFLANDAIYMNWNDFVCTPRKEKVPYETGYRKLGSNVGLRGFTPRTAFNLLYLVGMLRQMKQAPSINFESLINCIMQAA